MKSSFFPRVLGLVGIILVLFLMGQDLSKVSIPWIDAKAALLVFIMPWLVLCVFQKESVSLSFLFKRFKESRKIGNKALTEEMVSLTNQISNGGIRADLARLADNHQDSFLRYCAGLFNSKFTTEELQVLMQKRLQAEDENWQGLNLIFGFLAKMAPYFGMLATVIGMIHLLRDMQDFSNISASMALALQGTLYGLVSFTLVFSPIQKWVSGFKESMYKRNSLIAHWFILLSLQRDPMLIKANLEVESEV